ncbi:LysM peptidoglycan-binding domain-containing protein [bacterium]|nr:LysM peptidoglycan-binding domain-containing protein [bacterium]OIO85058.1 MAG: hypothetical protein AUK01_07455 [Anaerolineae bacterium CG2_30_57_67]
MKSSKLVRLFVLVFLAISASACTQRASTAPVITPTTLFPQASAATPGMGMIEQLATQTELAKLGGLPSVGQGTPGTPGTPPAIAITPLPFTTPLDGGATALPSLTPDAGAPAVQPPAAVTPFPTVPVSRPASYTLSVGEFPYCIARRFNINPDELLTLNGLSDGQILQPGLTLRIPQTGIFPADRALKPHPTTYTVYSGDTLSGIACKFGDVDPVNIATVNGLSATTTLTVGQVLQIP